MTAHLKARNSSWKLGKTQYSNITFSNSVGCVYENDEGLFLLFRGKKTKIKKIINKQTYKDIKLNYVLNNYYNNKKKIIVRLNMTISLKNFD